VTSASTAQAEAISNHAGPGKAAENNPRRIPASNPSALITRHGVGC
jgi:hypothetical protein